MKNLTAVVLILLFTACKNGDAPANTNGQDNPNTPKAISYSIINTFAHDTSSYTQGLIIYKGQMYEGTGLEGRSKLMKVDLPTGRILQKVDLAAKYFGEGITILRDTLYQLTW